MIDLTLNKMINLFLNLDIASQVVIRKTRHIGNLEYVVSRHILTSGSFVNVAWFDFDNLR